MTRREVIVRAIAKQITWIQAAWICGITDRHMRRLKERYLAYGYDGLVDQRGGDLPFFPLPTKGLSIKGENGKQSS